MAAVQAVQQFSDELEADCLEHFGVDLLDLWRGRLSLRRVHVLLQSLLKRPGRSAFLAALDASAEWSVTDHLIARLSDAAEVANFLFIKANSERSDGLQLPEPIPRPGQTATSAAPEPERDFADARELTAFLTSMNTL
ncbi:hypothetical protein ABT354_11225 [Streptomyces sp. NPDC000594]|uniref:hypothetical protein n=1 Tax=Streptomyces sp. NPDC000594 TaxID=3154261 RepID=UPI00332A5F84